jgi:hypothetical protein
VRYKHFIGALAGVLVLAVAGVAIASPQFNQVAGVKLSKTKAGKSIGVNASLKATDPGASPKGNLKGATKVVISLPKGTVANTAAVKPCTADDAGVQGKECPASSKVGTGSAKATVYNRAKGVLIAADQGENITAYAGKGQILFLLTPQGSVGATLVIHSKLSKSGVLTTNVPKLEVLGSSVILTDFNVSIKAKSSGSGKSKKNLLTAPKKCTKAGFVSTAKFTYDDGSSSKAIKTTQKCSK